MRTRFKLALLCALCSGVARDAFPQPDAQAQSERYAEAGQRALAAGRYEEARASYEQLAQLEPAIAEVHATLAVIYIKTRDYEQAVREIHSAKKLKPGLPKLDSLLGVSLSEMGEFTTALPYLEKGLKQTADPEVRRMCGLQLLRAYTNLGMDSNAVETALILNRSFPDDPEVLYHTGRIYGNFTYMVMEKLHNKAPDSVWMLQAQGEANESQKDYDAAIAAFNHVLALEPRRPGVHFRIGRVYLARYAATHRPEDREAAKQEFTSELGLDPSNGNSSYELAQMSTEDNDLESARKQFENLATRFPDFEQALVGLGGVYLQTQMGAEAIAPLERATKLDADDEVAWYRLAQAERAAGNRDAADKALATFRKLYASVRTARNPRAADEVTPQQLGSDAQP